MQTSIATVSLSGSLRDKLEAIAAAGFDGVEIFENDLLSFDQDAHAVRTMAEDLGLKIIAFQPFRDFEGMPEPQRSRVFDRAERKFDLMEQLQTDLLLVCSNVSQASLGGLDRAAEDLYELGERASARSRPIRVGFEALAWGQHINDYRDAWEVVRRANHPAVGVILDSFHILSRKLDPSAVASIPRERIFLVQVADAPLLDMDILSWSRHFRCFPGQGRLPLLGFMKALQATRYDGFLSLEIFNDQFRAAPPRPIAVDGKRSLIYMSEQSAQEQDKPKTPVLSLPPQAAYRGIEFLEFAVDEETAAELETVFTQLGFQQRGQHRSKDVSLWCQGDVNLVINRETDGFAHSFKLIHGPSVCAMGFQTENAEQALARAQAYQCQLFRQPVGPGELEIPAVHGVENSLIYLVERYGQRGSIWEVDFTLQPPDSAHQAGAGLQSIDHLSQVMPYAQLASWLLFYRSVFGFEAETQLDIPDPSGLIQSQVVETPDQTIRIVLNASQSQGTMAARFLSEYFGAGVQQLAFSTTDIFATVERLEANGVPLLPIPENYYDDLEARFGLDAELLQRLQKHNILYDQLDGGEFFQVYTQTFASRFFFEIVERRQYSQFGAVNAPIRLAAQARLQGSGR